VESDGEKLYNVASQRGWFGEHQSKEDASIFFQVI